MAKKPASDYTLYDMHVTPGFREELIRLVPPLRDRRHMRMFQYLTWSIFSDDSGIVLPDAAIHEIVENHYKGICGADHLSEFINAVEPHGIIIKTAPGNRKNKKAQTVQVDIINDIGALISDESCRTCDLSTCVDLVTGKPWSQRREDKQRAAYEQALRESQDPNHPAAGLLEYLNTCPTVAVESHVRRRIHLAGEWTAQQDDTTSHGQSPRRYAENVLMHIKQRPWVHYKTAGYSTRLFADRPAMQNAPRHMRRILLGGCYELDLKACQIAIAAEVLNCPQVRAFLQSGDDFWDAIIAQCFPGQDVKDTLKSAMYACLFGCSVKNIKDIIAQVDADCPGTSKAGWKRFRQHDLVSEIFTRRKMFLDKIRDDGGAEDAFGRWIPLDTRGVRQLKPGATARQIEQAKLRSIAAEVMQSHEMAIMRCVEPVLRANRWDIHVMCWLHDGFVVKFRDSDPKKVTLLLRKLCNAVNSHIGDRFPTRLDWNRVPDSLAKADTSLEEAT